VSARSKDGLTPSPLAAIGTSPPNASGLKRLTNLALGNIVSTGATGARKLCFDMLRHA
jgi:hypothetical protein